jgi:hypothetical protein
MSLKPREKSYLDGMKGYPPETQKLREKKYLTNSLRLS